MWWREVDLPKNIGPTITRLAPELRCYWSVISSPETLLSWVLSKDEALLRLVGLGGHCRDLVSSLEQNLADVKQKLLLKLLTESERNFIASYETDDEMMRWLTGNGMTRTAPSFSCRGWDAHLVTVWHLSYVGKFDEDVMSCLCYDPTTSFPWWSLIKLSLLCILT